MGQVAPLVEVKTTLLGSSLTVVDGFLLDWLNLTRERNILGSWETV